MLGQSFGKSLKERGKELGESRHNVGHGLSATKLTDMELSED